MKKLKVMQITHDLDFGGLQQVIINICKSIDRNRFDMSILCLRGLGSFLSEAQNFGIKVIFISPKNGNIDYFSFIKVANIFRREKPNVIHTHNTQPLIDGTLAALITGIKTIIHTDHARSFPDKKRYMLAERLMSRFVFKMVGVSNHTSNNLIKYENVPTKKIITIYNGIDEKRFDIFLDKERKVKSLKIYNKGPFIGLTVRLTEQKGISYLLKAMPKVIEKFPGVALVIGGEGPLENELKKEAFLLGIHKNTFFIGPRLDIPEILKILDLYVLPSIWEGLPIALLEAMAARCPIIATRVSGNPEIIKHRENGSLVSPQNPQELADELLTVLSNAKLRQKYSELGYKCLVENFSQSIMVKHYEKLYLRNFPH